MSATPADPHQWQESVLSTRSLSFVSQADALENSSRARQSFPPTRKSTLASISDYDDAEILEMHRAQQTDTAKEHIESLPTSVSQSPLFRLPREMREAIYLHLLRSPLGFNFPADKVDRHVDPSILRTCKAVYRETVPLLYTLNRLIFSHPSDANMFRHALASQDCAARVGCMILRIKSSDARLWTAYFNSTADERSLVRDYPDLKTLYVRFRGPKFLPFFGHEQNALHWLRDPKLQEVVVSVRKCVADVRVDLCVQVPEDWHMGMWESAVARMLMEQEGQNAEVLRSMGYVWIYGVWMKLETEGT